MPAHAPARGAEGVRRSRAWLVPLAVFLAGWTLAMHPRYSASGDEPHYLMVSQSLLADGDLDVANNYASGQGVSFGAPHLRPGPHVRRTRDGRLYPVHDVGLPVLLLPAFAAASRLAGVPDPAALQAVRMTPGLLAYALTGLFVLLASALAAGLTRAALVGAGTPPGTAALAVLAVWLAAPVLGNASAVYPEPIALLATAWTLYLALRRDPPGRARTLALAATLGALPWLHRKLALYALGLLLAFALTRRRDLARLGPGTRAAAVALLVIPPVALALWSLRCWGTALGPLALDRAPVSLEALRTGALGLLVDRESGLFTWAPAFLLLPVGWALGGRRHAPWLLPALALFLLSAAHLQWWGGFSPAGRFLLPLAPIFALAGAELARARPLRPVLIVLLAIQVAIAAIVWQTPRVLWALGDGHNRALAPLLAAFGAGERALPSLRAAPSDRALALGLVLAIGVANALAWLAARRRRVPPEEAAIARAS